MTAHAFSNPSQLILRNSDHIQAERLLMLAPPVDGLAGELLESGNIREVVGLTRDFAAYQRLKPVWERGGHRQTLQYGTDLADETLKPFDGILLFLQKSKPLMDFWLDHAVTLLAPGGCVWLVGENNEGIKSWRKRLKQHLPDVVSLDNARHCGLLEATGHAESASVFQRDYYWQKYPVNITGHDCNSFSLPGVFSHGRLDRGTAVLLETFDDVSGKQVLDFGCGAGIISLALGKRLPNAHLTLVDSDALALASSQKTLTENNLTNHRVLPSDGLSEVKETFDLIVSNPPFHQGVKTHYDVTEQFLAQSKKHLNRGGELRIVANSFLRYEPIIVKTLGACETVVTKGGFSVYRAHKR